MTDPMDQLIQWLSDQEKALRDAILNEELSGETYHKLKHERRIFLEVQKKAVALRDRDYLVTNRAD